MVDHDGQRPRRDARELAFLDAQGGRPAGLRRAPRRSQRAARAPRALTSSSPDALPAACPSRVSSSAPAITALRPARRLRGDVPESSPRTATRLRLSGVAEMRGGAARAPDRTRPLGGLVAVLALLAAVFPANVNMAVHAERFRGPGAAPVGAAAAAGRADRLGLGVRRCVDLGVRRTGGAPAPRR